MNTCCRGRQIRHRGTELGTRTSTPRWTRRRTSESVSWLQSRPSRTQMTPCTWATPRSTSRASRVRQTAARSSATRRRRTTAASVTASKFCSVTNALFDPWLNGELELLYLVFKWRTVSDNLSSVDLVTSNS